MRTRSLILLVLLVTLSGCIVTYRDFPNATRDTLPRDYVTKPFFYHVEPVDEAQKIYGNRWMSALSMLFIPGYYPSQSQIDPFGQPGYHAVGRTLTASGMFSDLTEIENLPKAGFFLQSGFRTYSSINSGTKLSCVTITVHKSGGPCLDPSGESSPVLYR